MEIAVLILACVSTALLIAVVILLLRPRNEHLRHDIASSEAQLGRTLLPRKHSSGKRSRIPYSTPFLLSDK